MKNESLTPQKVGAGSSQKVWWICEKGHEWQAAISSRVSGSGCPVCANKTIIPGINDLASHHPKIAAQWHPVKNAPLLPTQVSPQSNRKVWWQCEHGHEWYRTVADRVNRSSDCPYCAGTVVLPGYSDLKTLFPELAEEWHPTKNGVLTPTQVTRGSHKSVWWKCALGHEWKTTIASRVAGHGCPVCANKRISPGFNDLATCYPLVAAQWHPTKNDPLLPTQISPNSNRRVWWRCSLGHEWHSTIVSRTAKSTGCPYCAGVSVLAGFNDLSTVMPDIAKEWHPTLNGTLTPDQVTKGSSRSVWWQCTYGHIWKAVIANRTKELGTGCPVCAGRGRSARQRYYAQIEKDAALAKLAEESGGIPAELWLGAIPLDGPEIKT